MKKVNKKLASAIVLGLLMAMPFGASASDETGKVSIDTNGNALTQEKIAELKGKDVTFTNTAETGQIFASVTKDSNVTVEANTIQLDGAWANNAFYASNGGTLTINAGKIETISDKGADCNLLQVWEGTMNINADEFVAHDVYTGLYAQKTGTNTGDSNLNFNGGILDIEAGSAITAVDYLANKNSDSEIKINVNADTVKLVGTDGYGIRAHSTDTNYKWDDENSEWIFNYTDQNAGTAKVNVIAKNSVYIEGSKGAIYVVNGLENNNSEAIVKAKDITIKGDIYADTNAKVEIGGDYDGIEFNKADITGNITAIDSDVNVHLGNGGTLTGSIATSGTSLVQSSENTDQSFLDDTASAKGVNLDMGNGSTWNVTGDSEVSKVTGIGTIAMDVSDTENVDKVKVGSSEGASLTVAAQQNADHVKSSEEAVKAMAAATTGISEGTIYKVNEGILMGGSSAVMGENGIGAIKTDESTSTLGNMKSLASVAILSWRQEDSTFSQRLGELRETKDGQGIWARMSRGEFKYKGEFKNQYNYFQIGYDKAFGDWHYGAAISYNDGKTSYAEGYGENDSTSLSLYGTWLGDRGQYTDIVLKEGRLNNKYTNHAGAGTTSADYDMWGTSISAEYGQKLDIQDGWFVTPQAQLTYMRIGGENYTAQVATTDGIKAMQVRQDALDSFVGRIGLEAGKSFSDKGSFYAKASLLHEFAGDADTYLSLNGLSNSYSQDLGDTWYECGFGINYKITDTSYLYADVVRTFGGDIDTPWQWNLGMRFSV